MESFKLKSCSFQKNTDNRVIVVFLNPKFRVGVEDGSGFVYFEPKCTIPVTIKSGKVAMTVEDNTGEVVGGPWFCRFKVGEMGWWTLLVEGAD